MIHRGAGRDNMLISLGKMVIKKFVVFCIPIVYICRVVGV